MRALKLALVLVVALLLQLGLFSRFSIGGGRPDVVLLAVIAAGYVGGEELGAGFGFAAGLLFDVFLATPFGFLAFCFTVVGYLSAMAGRSVLRSAWWLAALAIAGLSAASVLAIAAVGELLDQATLSGVPVVAIVAVVAVSNALLAPAAVAALRWASTDQVEHRRRSLFV